MTNKTINFVKDPVDVSFNLLLSQPTEQRQRRVSANDRLRAYIVVDVYDALFVGAACIFLLLRDTFLVRFLEETTTI
ncbi:hypothetical protein OUZ56_010800 [Daphnia magna]|uniref:Uncharacterized protein n=1 Tax=Daphnia magna TaxID=35525 RepID=A0ABQ9YZU3_9CRUS|nr:hypothetical protein OUZ56_010800 [Daphnia magna]